MIGLLGISYKTAPLEIREQFSFEKEDILEFSERLFHQFDFSEIVVISTCNRTEIYFSQNNYSFTESIKMLFESLIRFKNVETKCQEAFYSFSGMKAARHLFEVTSGIDSMVIGEDQVISQVKEAYMFCTEANLTDAVLMRLFQKSFEAGKRVRTETDGIRKGATSISHVAAELCLNLFPDLSEKTVLLIGAGEIGSLALQSMVKKGAKNVKVANRTFQKAEKLASSLDGKAIPFEHFEEFIPKSDIIMVATGSQQPIITRKMVEDLLPGIKQAPLVFVDLSVPRNVEEKVGELEKVQRYGVDDLQQVIQENTEKRKSFIQAARQIIEDVLEDYEEWLSSRSLRPAIRTIKSNLEKINHEELANYLKPGSDETLQFANEYANHLTQKYTRLLIKNLKEATHNGKNTHYIEFVNKLFKLG